MRASGGLGIIVLLSNSMIATGGRDRADPPLPHEMDTMGIRKSEFGEHDGQPVEAYDLEAGSIRARVITYGGF